LIRTGLVTGAVVLVLMLASAAWIGYSTRTSCASIGSPAAPQQTTYNKKGHALVDEILPVYHFGEKHSVFVEAAPRRVFDSLQRTKDEEQAAIRMFDLLPVIAGKRDASSFSGHGKPLYEMLRETSGLVLEEPKRELVTANIATVDEHTPRTPQTVRGFVVYRLRHNEMKLPVSFRVDPEERGSRLTTETRIAFADRALCRGFGWYWGTIYPGSSLVRADFLRAVKHRSETASSGNRGTFTETTADGGAV
jgi:hypothetical protein